MSQQATAQLVKKEEHQIGRIKQYLTHPKIIEQMDRLLPQHLTAERMWSVMLTAINKTPKLAECTPESLAEAMMKCSLWGLEPCGEHGVWLIPYGDQVQAIRDYRGEMDLALRCAPELSHFEVPRIVYETDDFDIEYGDHPHIIHKPTRLGQRRGPMIGCYAIAKLRNGTSKGVVLSSEDVERHRQASRAKDSGPWKTHPESMWLKSAIKDLCKWLPRMSTYAAMRDDESDPIAVGTMPKVTVLEDPPAGPSSPATAAQRLAARIQSQAPASAAAPPPKPNLPTPPGPAISGPVGPHPASAQSTHTQPDPGGSAEQQIAAIKKAIDAQWLALVTLLGSEKEAERAWKGSDGVQSQRGCREPAHFQSRLDQAQALVSRLAKARGAAEAEAPAAPPSPAEDEGSEPPEPWEREPTDEEIEHDRLVSAVNDVRKDWFELTGEQPVFLEGRYALDALRSMLKADTKKLEAAKAKAAQETER